MRLRSELVRPARVVTRSCRYNRRMCVRARVASVILAIIVLLGGSGSAQDDVFVVCDELENAASGAVVQGEDGWLFSAYDLRVGSVPNSVKPYLRRLVRTIARQDTILVPVLLPTRGSVNFGRFDMAKSAFRDYPLAAAHDAYRTVLADFAAVGAPGPDLLESALEMNITGAPFYHRTDNHWRPEGARRAANDVAALLEVQGVLADRSPEVFVTEFAGTFSRHGSFAKLVESRCAGVDIPEETGPYYLTTRQREATAQDLFADLPAAEVVLVGTSNSEGQILNFEGFLAEALQTDILNASVRGGGTWTSLLSYLSSDAYLNHRPAVLIWELPIVAIDGLGTAHIAEYRQAIPAADGACSVEDSRLATVVPIEGTQVPLLINDEGLAIGGTRFFLYLELSDPSLFSFEVEIRYRGGQEELVRIERSTRATNFGRFFLEFSAKIDSRFEEVRLHVRADATGTVAARICRRE